MLSQSSLFHNSSLFLKIAFKFRSNSAANFPSARSSISAYQTIVNPSLEIIPSAAA